MRWRGRRQSENVEDRRGQGGGTPFPFPFPRRGSGGRMPRMPGGRRGGMGIMGILVVVGIMLLFGIDPRVILQGGVPEVQQPVPRQSVPHLPGRPSDAKTAANDEAKQFVSVVLADTEDVWGQIFKAGNARYKQPTLVLFSNYVRSACGMAPSAAGPFYCPLDQKVYIDLTFFNELKSRFGAPGDFAQAYVVAHEVGHHVQTLLGIARQVQEAKSRVSQRQANALQVRMELQADCYAGIWAHHADRTKNILEPGDIEEALGAASAIGDDTLQKKQQGYVVPDSFTHGSSKQRVRWFKRGFESGRLESCDTFNAASL